MPRVPRIAMRSADGMAAWPSTGASFARRRDADTQPGVPSAPFTREELHDRLVELKYFTTARLETAILLDIALEKPLLAEGPAGAGKTEIGKVLAALLDTDLVRLQCYEGLDEARALYEWNYQKQLLRIQADQASHLG